MEQALPFPDRRVAGLLLAQALQAYRGGSDAVVLALVRGGVAVGRPLADELGLPLYPYIARKLGHPEDREFAVGALAEGGATYLDDEAMKAAQLSWEDMQPIIEEESAELKRRKEAYLVHARPPLSGKTVIVADDGAATGATLFAVLEDLRLAGVRKLVLALPVCAPDTAAKLKKLADETVLLATPSPFRAVGLWYAHFPQVEDAEVLQLLSK